MPRSAHPAPAPGTAAFSGPPRGLAGLRLAWDFFFNKPEGTVPDRPIPVHPLSRRDLLDAADGSLWRLGHSTLLMKLSGRFWLTDPVFSDRASPLSWMGPRRFHAPPIAISDLPDIEAVILSHDHYDHLDKAAVRALAGKTAHFVAPTGVGGLLAAWGVPAAAIIERDWWGEIRIGDIRLTATPAQHFSGRGLHDRNLRLWCSWVIEADGLRLFFSGDSGYFDGFATIGDRLGPFDVTCLETGAYDRRWTRVHMLPEQTAAAHRDLGGRWLLPIHNGTFDLAFHPWAEPLDRISHLAAQAGIPLLTPSFGARVDLRAPSPFAPWWPRERTVPDGLPEPSDVSGSFARS